MTRPASIVRWLARTGTVVLLVILGSTFLIRFSPGYLDDAREMDARYGDVARTQLAAESVRSRSLNALILAELRKLAKGDLGESRQFAVPVSELIEPRLAVTGMLILRALAFGWTLAVLGALVSATRRRSSLFWHAPASLLLAVPTAAMATVCLVTSVGGPVLVMALLIAARDFKFLHTLLFESWTGSEALQARAQGIRPMRLLYAHILPRLRSRVLALGSLSLVTALSALVPVEVIFDVPGLGQLAWNAALNRDLPVLLAVTILMAMLVTVASTAPASRAEWTGA